MATIAKLWRRIAFLIGARRQAADLAAELEDHRARIQALLERDGLPPQEAAARSRKAMGNMTLAREDARDVWISALAQRLWRDAAYGARVLRHEPAFAIAALLTLALGIATAATVFSVADAELWRPLPFPDSAQLVAVHVLKPGAHSDTDRLSASDFREWRAQARLADYAAQASTARRILRRERSEYVSVQPVTANYFQLLNHVPRLGRAFTDGGDDHARVAILSDRGWRRVFDANPDALGRSLLLDGVDYTVVGIQAGQHFEFGGNEPDVYVTIDLAAEPYRDPQVKALWATGRMRPGVQLPQAEAELDAIVARLSNTFPRDYNGHRVTLEDLRRASSGYNWRPILFFLGAAALVLVLSCLNVATLLLARALRRQREFAMRAALGGGRGALIRQLLVEGALLAVPGAAIGALGSTWALHLFASGIPEDYLERGGHFDFNGRIGLFIVLLSAATTVMLSLAPLLFARRVNLNVMLAGGGRTAGPSRQHVRARNGLLVAQLALTLVLMTGASLFLASFTRLLRAPLGFEPQDRLAVRVTLTGPAYGDDESQRAFAERLLEAARSTPGVADAAIDTTSPLDSGPLVRLVAAEGTRPPVGEEPAAIMRAVSPDFFRALAIPIRGRAFGAMDAAGAPRVAILNEYLAAKLFPGGNAVGRRIELVPGARVPWTRRPGIAVVVGVAANAKNVGINEVEFGNVYLPFAQAPSPGLELIVRASTPGTPLAAPLRTLASVIDPALPVSRVQTMTDRVADALKADRFHLLLIGAFACVAIVLAVVGIYGAMACAVQERRREFGVRLALGQQPSALVRSTLWQSVRFGIAGTVAGLAIVIVGARLIGNALYLVRGEHNGLLYGVTTTDPASLAAAVAALIGIATVAGFVPARQTSRVDPVIALRQD